MRLCAFLQTEGVDVRYVRWILQKSIEEELYQVAWLDRPTQLDS
jgi:hypothetical protein